MQVSYYLLPPLLFLLTFTTLSHGAANQQYANCAPFEYACGTANINISYPFELSGSTSRPNYCGYPGYILTCSSDNKTLSITINNHQYQVLKIDYTNQLLLLVDSDLANDPCTYSNSSISNSNLFQFSDRDQNVTIYFNCSSQTTTQDPSIVDTRCALGIRSYYQVNNGSMDSVLTTGCSKSVQIPMSSSAAADLESGKAGGLTQALQEGFYLGWTVGSGWCSGCKDSGGYCGSKGTGASSFADHTCFCPNGTSIDSCNSGSGKSQSKNVVIGVVGALGGLILVCALGFFFYKRKTKKHLPSYSSSHLIHNIPPRSFSKKDFVPFSFDGKTLYFSYEELADATNGFDEANQLGEGGYGTVYKGVLRNGRVVAVKRLYETNYKRVEQFMNEVELLSSLRHPNLVTLFGSTSPSSSQLLLVYEFVSNGTIADHLHDPDRSQSLPLPLRLSMAIDTAAALSYLHSVDIIHRDIKTHNFLVDDSFRVKVADFGLSRLFPPNATHVTTAPQGTPGYLDPEYHRVYQLTDKSDVYSFGVVLMELISSRPAVDVDRRPNEISLAMVAVSKIQKGELGQLVDPVLGFYSDQEVNRVVTQIAELAFRCLQMDREMRPSMKEVLEELRAIERGRPRNEEESKDRVIEESKLLKMAPYSPDSVVNPWISSSTTPNISDQMV